MILPFPLSFASLFFFFSFLFSPLIFPSRFPIFYFFFLLLPFPLFHPSFSLLFLYPFLCSSLQIFLFPSFSFRGPPSLMFRFPSSSFSFSSLYFSSFSISFFFISHFPFSTSLPLCSLPFCHNFSFLLIFTFFFSSLSNPFLQNAHFERSRILAF